MRLERLGQLKISNDLIGNRTRDQKRRRGFFGQFSNYQPLGMGQNVGFLCVVKVLEPWECIKDERFFLAGLETVSFSKWSAVWLTY
jgi:hypothetical protein